MKNSTESKKEATTKAPKAKRQAAVKPTKTAKRAKESADRLPATLDELKAGKAGLATYLFLTGKGKDEIASELEAAFKLSGIQAAKIVRRIVGRARFFQRAMSLVTVK